jgi:hypothetical protein
MYAYIVKKDETGCCKTLTRQRYNVFGKPFVEPIDISTASVRDLCLFIRGTGLLNLYRLDYLGLHNKPKAEVYPGHKLAGPKEEEEEEEGSYEICVYIY